MNTPNLTRDQFNQISEGYARFHELRAQAIQTPNTAAEIKGITEMLANAFINHGGEFLGCWVAVRDEYEPAIMIMSRIGQRLGHLNAMVAQQRAAAESNIVPITK